MLLLFSILSFLEVVFGREHSPVIIWGDYGAIQNGPVVPALGQMRAPAFSQFLHRLTVHRPQVLLFTEHNLSIEDFSWRAEDDSPIFPHIHDFSRTSKGFVYLPSVEAPISVLHQLTHHGYSFAKYDEESPPTLAAPAILTVNLREPEADEPRQAFLRAHDNDMARITRQAINKYGRVLVVYTGRHASFVAPIRHKREAEEEKVINFEKEIVMTGPGKKLYIVTYSPIIFQKEDSVFNLTDIIHASVEKNNNVLDVRFREGSVSLDFVFNAPTERHSWTLESIKVEDVENKQVDAELKSQIQIGGPPGYSYFCAKDVTFFGFGENRTKYSVTFRSIQAQPHVVNDAFGPAVDCVPYFSEPILSGLLVILLLMVVGFLGILSILDIRNNDKFDDPKGKVLSISYQE